MKLLAVLSILLGLTACDRQPFVEFKLDLDKQGDDCSQLQSTFRMTSNFGGERFELQKCLPVDYDKALLKTERKGDTVVVLFPTSATGQKNVLYNVTLDIDSYPRYGFITIDNDTYTIIPN
jgi:hypothetical protein